jgi:high affinity Mn2+ porin
MWYFWNRTQSLDGRAPWRLAAMLILTGISCPARAQDATPAGEGAAADAAPESYSLHAQFTLVDQYHPGFASAYRGANSLDPGNRGDETTDLTLFAGIRLPADIEFYVDPEIDQGFGLSNTLGVAGFTSGEAYKVGATDPYLRIPRAFFRKTFDLGGDLQKVEPDQNQLGGAHTADDLIVTIGKFSVTDIFDTNAYAHDPKADFLDWSIIDAGAFDYAADAWGYSYGAAAEWTQAWWTLRGGIFDLSRTPNSKQLERGFEQFEAVIEAEERHEIGGEAGKLKLLVYDNRAKLADYSAAIQAAAGTATAPDVAAIRRYAHKPGIGLNLEQAVTTDLGLFARASLDDGHLEAEEFTEINQSVVIGLSLKGGAWTRPDDTLGLAQVVNDISKAARNYFADGGLGILIGDGRLSNPGLEKITEAYYSAAVAEGVAVSLDYQLVVNPAYNRDRGPVSVFGFRLHAGV